MDKRIVIGVVVLAVLGFGAWRIARENGPARYTGFVEGEERIIRSEVTGRALEVPFREGDLVPANAVVARLDSRDIESRLESKRREVAVTDAEIRSREERVRSAEATWQRDVAARRTEVDQAASAADLAERTFRRERDLVGSGASTEQFLDDARARRDQAQSALARAKEMRPRSAISIRTTSMPSSSSEASPRCSPFAMTRLSRRRFAPSTSRRSRQQRSATVSRRSSTCSFRMARISSPARR